MPSFFDLPPPPEPPPGRPWAGRRSAAIGRTVALNLVIGRSQKAALWIPALTACASGFEFDIELRHDLDEDEFMHPFFDGPYPRRRRRAPEGVDPGLLRFGIQFSDGRKATNLERRIPSQTAGEPDRAADDPVLSPRGGGGGDGRWRQGFWVAPLPPQGPLAFVCEWPAAGIAETRHEIDSTLVRDAATDAQLLWSATKPREDSGSWTAYGTEQVVLSSSPDETPAPDPDDDSAA